MDAATIFWGKEFNRLISPSFRGNTLEEKSQPAPVDVKNRVPFFGRVSCITAQCSNQISEPSTISSSLLPKCCHWLEITPQFSRNGFSVGRNPALKLRFSAPKINKNDDWDQLPCLSEMFPHFQLRVFELLGLPFPLDHGEALDSQSKMQTCLPYTTSLRFNQVQSSATIGKPQSSVLAVQPFAPQDVAGVVGSHNHGPCRVWCPNNNGLKLYPDLRFANGWWLEKFQRKMFFQMVFFHGGLPR